MIDNLKKKLDDPFDTNSYCPIAVKYLLESDIYLQGSIYRQRKIDFQKNENFLFREHNQDYFISSPQSFKLSQNPVQFNDSITELLFKRESTRQFRKQPMCFDTLSFLLLMSLGLKDNSKIKSKRMYPSGGALYTNRVYLDIRNVSGLERGIYLFNPYLESLDLVNDNIEDIDRLNLQNKTDPDVIKNSCLQFLVTIRPQLSAIKYGELSLKLALIETGHLMQNIALISTGLGLAGYTSCALNLKQSEKSLRTNSLGEFLIYSYSVGFSE